MSKVVKKNAMNRAIALSKNISKPTDYMMDLITCIDFCESCGHEEDYTEENEAVKFNSYSYHLNQPEVQVALDNIVSSCEVVINAMQAAEKEIN